MSAIQKEPNQESRTIHSTNKAPQSGRSGRWSIATNSGAIVTAFFASACCVGPLVLALLGIGGGALLVRFEPYRPYFMAVTFVFLGLGFWLQYRKPKSAACVEGESCNDCPTPRVNKVGRVMLWVATVLVVGFLAFPYIASLIWK